MRKTLALLCTLATLSTVACAYGDMTFGQNGKLYVVRADGFLFGALRKVYECDVKGTELACVAVPGRP